MYPTNTVVQLAKISQYLASNAISLGIEKDTQFANKLYVERKSIEWAYEQDPTDETLVKTTNYLYTMCGSYVFQALGIIGSQGGVVPPPSGGGGVGSIPYPKYIVLQSGNISGTTIKATYQPDWYGLSGFAYCFINNNQFALDVNFTYATLTGIFDFSLTPYTPQIGDVFTVQAFKAST